MEILIALAVGYIILVVFRRRSLARNPLRLPHGSPIKPYKLKFEMGSLPRERIGAAGGAYGEDMDRYLLDLGKLTCTCADWQKKRQYKRKDPRRLCRHLVRELRDRRLIAGTDNWSQAIIDNASGIPDSAFLIRLTTAPNMLLVHEQGSHWFNIFAHTQQRGQPIAEASGPIERFGWSPDEQRWSYGKAPPGSRELRQYLG